MFVTIDLDGVLIKNPFGTGVFPEVRRRVAPVLVAQGCDEKEAGERVMARVRAGHRRRLMAGDWVGAYDWDAIINEAAAEFGYDQPIDVAALVRKYCVPGYIAAYDDAGRALAYLRSRFRRVYWLSNGYHRYQYPVIEALGLDRFFDGGFAPDTYGAAKPATGLFLAAAQAAGCPPWAGVHIGDTLSHDVAGARRSGMRAIWIDRSLDRGWCGSTPGADGRPSDALVQLTQERVRLEECYEVYSLALPAECLPDAAITSLDQLPPVLAALSTGMR